MSDLNNLNLEEQLMEQLEIMQAEIEKLKSNNEQLLKDNDKLQSEVSKKDLLLSRAVEQAEKDEQTIQTHLSEISKLKSQVQRMAERNEKLNGADKLVKQNAELEKSNSDLQRKMQSVLQDTETTVSAVKTEYAEKERRLALIQRQAEQARDTAESDRANERARIEARAKEIYQGKENELKRAYKSKEEDSKRKYDTLTASHETMFFGFLAYGILVTLFTAVSSERFVSDFKGFFVGLWGIIVSFVNFLLEGASAIAELGDKIPQPIVAVIVHWLLAILTVVIIAGGLGVLIAFVGSKLFTYYKSDLADNISLVVVLVTMAIEVFFAEPIRSIIPINLLLLFLIVHLVYMGVRWYVRGCKKSRGYY